MKAFRFLLLAAFAVTSAFAATETWDIDASHSSARFRVKHLMISNVSGEITGMKGTATVDPADLTTLKLEATLDPKTINTQNADRDKHLRAEDFLNVEKFPTITFKSKKVKKNGDKLQVVGDLTIRKVTKSVTLDSDGLTKVVTDPWGNKKRGFAATTTISRKDFGITWNKVIEGGGLTVGDELKVEIELELQAKKPAEATGKKDGKKKS